MPTTRKNLTPKHVMLKHDLLGAAPKDAPLSAYTMSRKRAPFSHGWLSTLVLGYHSPTWATALALSAMLLSEDLSRRITQPKSAHDSGQTHGKPSMDPGSTSGHSSLNYSSRNS